MAASGGAPRSSIDTRSPTYASNREAMLAMVSEVAELRAEAAAGGGQKYVDRHRERGKLSVRERVDLLLDRDSPFLELSALAGWGTDDPLGGGMVVGIGLVEGTECLISANDPTVRGGTSSPTSITKSLRSHEIALQNRLPVLNLTESGEPSCPSRRRSSSWAGRRSRTSPACPPRGSRS